MALIVVAARDYTWGSPLVARAGAPDGRRSGRVRPGAGWV